ncbi:MAG: hypothetical protein K9N46_09075 [Candidatus Marinimicrobia bacterium]|nr:hypothetical protein [Candidatus Neomarinimicrobiota bacterium]MCF7829391.1 hypothetical protein [Candidatus Neomarinimicrobiota bacterium]MCF7880877.1 hypothetical protein [Candidatus Neomarinimicrobiota bacterium]
MRRSRIIFIVVSLVASVSLMSCSTIIDSLIGGAVSGAGRAVGEHAQNAVYKSLAPDENVPPPTSPGWGNFMAVQAQVIFSYSFNTGMQVSAEENYEPGQWTRFEITSDDGDETTTLERGLLKRTDNGDLWWQLTWSSDESTWLYEGLVDSATGEVLRLRGQDPDGNTGEIPVSETTVNQTGGSMTEESMEGALVGTEDIATPAGTFTTEKYEFMGGMGGDTMQMWLTDEVPGGMVQYQVMSEGEQAWKSVLVDWGTDATTKLDSF